MPKKSKEDGTLWLFPNEAPLYKMVKASMISGTAMMSGGPVHEWIEDELVPAWWYDKDDLDSILGLE